MQVELYCPECSCCYTAAPDAHLTEILEQMSEEGPWSTLGDGATFEDRIAADWSDGGGNRCPECGTPVSMDEDSLGRLAMQLLWNW